MVGGLAGAVPNVPKAPALPKPGLGQPHLTNPWLSAQLLLISIPAGPCPSQTPAKPLWDEEPPPPATRSAPSPYWGQFPWEKQRPIPPAGDVGMGLWYPLVPEGVSLCVCVSPLPVDGGDDEGDGSQPQGGGGPPAEGQGPAGEGAQQGQ